jgi:Big-like domain-containing protein
MKGAPTLAWCGFLAAIGSACGGSDLLLPADARPATIAIVQGNNQSARIGEMLAEPLTVRVADGAGRPVAQARVLFAVVSGAGANLSPDAATTDAQGIASAQWALGSAAGSYAAEARVEGSSIEPARFTAFAAAGVPALLALVRGDAQLAPVGTALPESLVVRATDAAGNPVEGVRVTWSPGGGGSVSADVNATGADGRAGVQRTLGPTAGLQTTRAEVPGIAGSPVTFQATASSGTAGKLLVVTQPSATASTGAVFSRQPQVQLLDNLNNPVAQSGRAVTVTIASGPAAATLNGQRTRETDGSGLATFTDLALSGPSGSYTLGFSGADLAPTTSTTITLISGAISSTLSTVDADPESFGVIVGTSAVTVRVVDGQGNAIGGTTVVPTVDRSEATFQPASGSTDAGGRAVFTLRATRTGRFIVGARAGSVALQSKDTVDVVKLASAITIAADPPSPTPALLPVRVNWSVTGAAVAPTGTVSVAAGSLSCSASVASGGCSITPTVSGQLTIAASYSGDAVYLPSTATRPHQVEPAPTAVIGFSSSRPTAADDESVTLQATLASEAGTPSGTELTFARDACGPAGIPLATRSVNSNTGLATWTTKGLPIGTYALYACFAGTSTYAPSQAGPVLQTVTSRR